MTLDGKQTSYTSVVLPLFSLTPFAAAAATFLPENMDQRKLKYQVRQYQYQLRLVTFSLVVLEVLMN